MGDDGEWRVEGLTLRNVMGREVMDEGEFGFLIFFLFLIVGRADFVARGSEDVMMKRVRMECARWRE